MPNVPNFPIRGLDAKPFYASVGAGDAAIERLRARVSTLRHWSTVDGCASRAWSRRNRRLR